MFVKILCSDVARNPILQVTDFGARNRAFFVCAEHVRRLGGESPLDKLQELPDPLPLYGLPRIAAGTEKFLVVEGEKTADAAQSFLPGWCVVTWPGGAQRVKHADWELLQASAAPVYC